MSKIGIGPAQRSDVPLIHALLCTLEQSLGKTAQVKRQESDLLRDGFGDEPQFEALLAWEGKQAVGLAVFFREYSTWRGSAGVYVQDLYVAPHLRGSGLGRELMNAVYRRAKAWGGCYCKLSVGTKNSAAIAFYQRLGFVITDDERVLVREGLE